MTWYNPSTWSWFRKDDSDRVPDRADGEKSKSLEDTLDWIQEHKGNLVLYCANPQCERREITGDSIFYSLTYHEFYHDGECGTLANVHKVFQSGQSMSVNYDVITRDEAIDLIRGGVVKYVPFSPESNIRAKKIASASSDDYEERD
ncbi:MAG TPA: hypothetical protein HA282_01735 [Nanoarchaeota archaeon]|nr:MAG: hypothetical protein QT01_C0005G0031 [archaeon GW2011_AR6]MBS3082652.1 hypothetical protein [Candidatus Pacearchaeota archaeon]HIH17409.1 hypothetical protein [Nanoarchaeota archaeon]HIH34371.1 hypothetical protein [Nanoarchaeota archaeon]HIH51898.1 hypothetical protein [Nanoarchaeota archaeon]